MSKEMKMADYFDFSVSYIVLGVRDCSVIDDVDRNYTPCDAAEHAVRSHDRLVDEVAALREALRLKEAECEALAGDKSELLLSLNETVRALADICGANGIKGEDDFICEIEEFIVEMAINEKQTS